MDHKAANGTKLAGSPTAGANGDVTWFPIPGGIRINLSGHDVRRADGTQHQRLGLKPDVGGLPSRVGVYLFPIKTSEVEYPVRRHRFWSSKGA
jgi:hypothetical protein